MTDATLPDLIARLRERKGFGRFPGDATWFQLDQPDKDCTDAADALANQDEYIAEAYREGYREGQGDASGACAELWSLVFRWADKRDLIGEPGEPEGFTAHQLFETITEHEKELTDALAKAQATIVELIKQIGTFAREAGEAKGELEMSETAGVVEGWKERAEIAEAKVDELERKVYQPGVWRCAKCDFQLVQSTLNVKTGAVTARDDAGTKCPNDGSPMWRVSYQEDNAKAWKWGEEQFDLRQAAEARATALEARAMALVQAQAETIKHLDRALWQVTRLGSDLAGVNWQAVVGMMTGDIDRARCAALAQSREG